MLKQIIILSVLLLGMIAGATAVQICFTMNDDDFFKLKTAVLYNYHYKPSMNITENQFLKKVIISQWKREVTKYDLLMARIQLQNITIS